jgi:hypothetical protein
LRFSWACYVTLSGVESAASPHRIYKSMKGLSTVISRRRSGLSPSGRTSSPSNCQCGYRSSLQKFLQFLGQRADDPIGESTKQDVVASGSWRKSYRPETVTLTMSCAVFGSRRQNLDTTRLQFCVSKNSCRHRGGGVYNCSYTGHQKWKTTITEIRRFLQM